MQIGIRDESVVVVQHSGNNTRRTVGRRSDDAPARSVFFVDRDGVEVDPVHHGKRVGQPALGVFGQLLVHFARASFDIQSACEVAKCIGVVDTTTAPHAILHDLPNTVQLRVDLGLAAPSLLIGIHQLGDGEVMCLTLFEQLFARMERVTYFFKCAQYRRGVHVHAGDETTADREVFFFNQ